jgi:hypothetical protein
MTVMETMIRDLFDPAAPQHWTSGAEDLHQRFEDCMSLADAHELIEQASAEFAGTSKAPAEFVADGYVWRVQRDDDNGYFSLGVVRDLPDYGPCTRGCGQPAEVPWSGERLCWNCTDHDLDLLALALQSEDGWPVQVGSGHPGHHQELSTENHREGGTR